MFTGKKNRYQIEQSDAVVAKQQGTTTIELR
jgi:hypothetical protein